MDYRDELRCLAHPPLLPQPLDSLPQPYTVPPIFRDKTRKRGRRNRMGIICSVRTTTADLQAVMNAKTLPGVRLAPRRLPTLATDYPKAVSCMRDNLDELCTWWRYKSSPSANRSGPPTPRKGAFAKSDGEPSQSAAFPTALRWSASSSPSSTTKTSTRRQHPSPADSSLPTSPD